MTMRLCGLRVEFDVEASCGETLLRDGFNRKRISIKAQRRQRFTERTGIGTGIDQRRDNHVPTGAAEAIEIGDLHG